MNDIALTLPKIRGNKKHLKDKIEEHKKRKLQDDPNEFEEQMRRVIEIKIYLKSNFHKTDINDGFLSDLDEQYAALYLEKMGKISNKFNIQKILRIKPIEKCDFQLSVDTVRNKTIKVLHIFPNNKLLNPKKNKAEMLSEQDVDDVVNKTTSILKDSNEDKLSQIKKREIKKDEVYLYQPEIIDNLFIKAKDDINDKLLYLQASGNLEQQVKNFDLSIDTIRKKFMNPNKSNILTVKDNMTGKAKFQNIEKVEKRDILTDKAYEFPYVDIDLDKEILNEVNKPLEVPIEIIVKDINYILDNFPIDDLVEFVDENISNDNKSNNIGGGSNDKDNQSILGGKKDIKKIKSKEASTKKNIKAIINKLNGLKPSGEIDNNINNNNFINNILDKNHKNQNAIKYFKIKSVYKKDILYVYKKIQMPSTYRILGLLINLIYWIVFGYINRLQIDKYSKQQILFKIYEELNTVDTNFKDKKIYDKLFMPILILIVRIECEAIFVKKFKHLFENKTNMDISFQKINEIITHIFDPNCYFNTFTTMANDMNKLKHKIDKDLNPNYKTKNNATSNLLNQLFTSFTNEKNVKIFRSKFDEKKKRINQEGIFYFYFFIYFYFYFSYSNILDIDDQKKYILESKVEFYRVLLNRVNSNLKRRNLDPIFTIDKIMENEKENENENDNENENNN
jgi:hypothetical protein